MDKLLFWIIFTGIIVGQLVQISFGGRDAPVLDLAVVIAVVIGGYHLLNSGKYRGMLKLPVFRAFWVLVGVFLISLAANLTNFSISELALSFLFWLRFVAYGSLIFIFYRIVDKNSLNKFRQWLIWLFVVIAVLGFVQLGIFPSLEIGEYLGWDPHRGRLFSTFLDPNFVGVFLSLGLGWVLIFSPRTKKGGTYLGYLLAVVLVGSAILFTFSRSAFLAAIIIVAIITLLRRQQFFWIFLGILIVALAVSPRVQERVAGVFALDDTAIHRIVSWQEGLKTVAEHPWLGVGYNTLPFREDTPAQGRSDSGFDSSLLTVAATTGLLGLLSFLWFVITALKTTWRGISKPQLTFNFWFITATGGLLVGSLFLNAWFYPPILALWFIMLGLSLKEND